jgi:hypothetical protein
MLLDGFIQNHIQTFGTATITSGSIKHFHRTMCNWAFNIPLKFQWVAVIEAINANYLKNQILQIGNVYEGRGWNVSNSLNETTKNEVQSVVGCIFAQGVTIPGERVNVEYSGITEGSNRGFIKAPIITGRSDFEPLQMGFLETNRSFVDGFLRPWSIIVAHRGLIATNDSSSIKARITIHQLARTGSDQNSVIRKSFIFENCAPVNIASETLDYSASSDFPKIQATFVYSKYYVVDNIT